MCCEDEVKVSEDVRVIHNELEKAYSWIFAAQEILRPENEEFDPDVKDINNIETAIAFAIGDLQEAATLCQIYRAHREDPPKEVDSEKRGIFFKKIEDLADAIRPDVKIREAQEALSNLETKLEVLKSDPGIRRVRLTPPDFSLYRKP